MKFFASAPPFIKILSFLQEEEHKHPEGISEVILRETFGRQYYDLIYDLRNKSQFIEGLAIGTREEKGKDFKGTPVELTLPHYKYKITVTGRLQLINWKAFRAARRQFWVSITIAIVAMLISIGGIVWDSASDKSWQQEQIEILREISHTLNAAVIPAQAGISLEKIILDSGSSPE